MSRSLCQGGVFKPVKEVVGLRENQRVRLHIETLEEMDFDTWLSGVRKLREELARQGHVFDSTADIAEDRRRDV